MEEWEIVDVPTHQLKNGRWVAVVVEIRDNRTGEVREYETINILEDGDAEPSSYLWEEGNNSCDCNRKRFFASAAGKDGDSDLPCSDGYYSVRVRNKKSGRVFYCDFLAA